MKSLTEAKLRAMLEAAYARGTSDMDEMQDYLIQAKRKQWSQGDVTQKAVEIANRRDEYFTSVIKGA